MLLTEAEVAKVLRCSTSKIKRLRYAGELPFLPGRPVLIAEEDLHTFIASRKCGGNSPQLPPQPQTRPQTQADIAAAREWALNQILRRSKKR